MASVAGPGREESIAAKPALRPTDETIPVTFSAIHTDGDGEDNINWGSLERLFDELKGADAEHGDVSVVDDDTGGAISAHRDGRLVLEHLGDDPSGAARHCFPVQKADVLQIWARFMRGELEELLREPWKAGYV